MRLVVADFVCVCAGGMFDVTNPEFSESILKLSDQFELVLGTAQGDGLSLYLFVMYLKAVMRKVRAQLPPRPAADAEFIDNSEYADDCNMYSTSEQWLEGALLVIADLFSRVGLSVNVDKTECLEIGGGDLQQQQDWRRNRQLASLLGDEEMARRTQLAAVAMKKLDYIWKRYSVSLSRKIKLYNAYVLPILTFN